MREYEKGDILLYQGKTLVKVLYKSVIHELGGRRLLYYAVSEKGSKFASFLAYPEDLTTIPTYRLVLELLDPAWEYTGEIYVNIL